MCSKQVRDRVGACLPAEKMSGPSSTELPAAAPLESSGQSDSGSASKRPPSEIGIEMELAVLRRKRRRTGQTVESIRKTEDANRENARHPVARVPLSVLEESILPLLCPVDAMSFAATCMHLRERVIRCAGFWNSVAADDPDGERSGGTGGSFSDGNLYAYSRALIRMSFIHRGCDMKVRKLLRTAGKGIPDDLQSVIRTWTSAMNLPRVHARWNGPRREVAVFAPDPNNWCHNRLVGVLQWLDTSFCRKSVPVRDLSTDDALRTVCSNIMRLMTSPATGRLYSFVPVDESVRASRCLSCGSGRHFAETTAECKALRNREFVPSLRDSRNSPGGRRGPVQYINLPRKRCAPHS